MTGLRLGAALALVTAAARRDCRCEDLALARRAPVPRRVVVPAAFASRNLSSQVALLKVPETGSSTAANVFAELAAKFKRPAWVSMRPGEFERVVAAPARTAPKWALGHRGWGPWLRDHFDERVVDLATTARAPAAPLPLTASGALEFHSPLIRNVELVEPSTAVTLTSTIAPIDETPLSSSAQSPTTASHSTAPNAIIPHSTRKARLSFSV